MIYIELSTRELADMLLADDYANWSYEGAMALSEQLEDLHTDIDLEFDVVAIRCAFSEYSSREEFYADYDQDTDRTELDDKILVEGDTFVIVYEG